MASQASRRSQQGFVLVVMALASVVIFGCLGLATDLGRMYIAKNEAQGYADAAALAGVLKLDGTSNGVTTAKNTATALTDKWNFATSSFSGTVVEVASSLQGPWTNATTPPNPATNYIYLRVTANAPIALYFMPLVSLFAGVSSPATTSTVNAVAVAQQVVQNTFNEGAFPFSPMAFDGPTGGNNTSAPWGFVAGQQYTMRYPASGGGSCTGDSGDSNHTSNGSSRGFWGDNSAAVISEQVQGDLQEESLTVGQALPGVGGAKTTVATDIVDRVDQDTDTTDDVYSTYVQNGGNGRRVVTMPIQSEVTGDVLGFGTFFLLDNNSYGHTGNSIWCAIYIGQANVADTSNPGASSTPGAYQVKLVQ